MFCNQCGSENRDNAQFCRKCGKSLADDAPGATLKSADSEKSTQALWNPSAAVNWSLIFTPAFGSYLQMINWKALGEPQKAATARTWFYISLGMLILYVAINVAAHDSSQRSAQPLVLLYLIVWYFAGGRLQAKYVKERFGSIYPKNRWGKTILIGFAWFFAYALTAGIVVSALA